MGMQPEDRDFSAYRDSRDAEALARVFDVVAPRLLLLAAHLTPDAAQAEDLVQATFLRCMNVADDYDGARPVSAWLAGILCNCALDARRRSAMRHTEPLVGEATHARDGGPSALELASENEVFEQVSRAVNCLGNPYREVLVLRLVHGLEPTEIAHTLGRKPGSVRMQLKRGLEKLQREMPQFSGFLGVALGDSARGLAALRESILVQAHSLQAAASGATATAVATTPWAATGWGTTLSGILLMKTLWFAVAAGLLGLGLFWFQDETESGAPGASLHLSPTLEPESNRMISALLDPVDGPSMGVES